jgi:hypothetical protein
MPSMGWSSGDEGIVVCSVERGEWTVAVYRLGKCER